MKRSASKSSSKRFFRYYYTSDLLPYKGLAVMLVHMQDKFLYDIDGYDESKLYDTHSKIIQELCVENCVPLINVLYYRCGPLTYTLRKQIQSVQLAEIIIKKSVDAFKNNKRLNNILENLEITTLFSMGVYATGCLIKTSMGGKDNDYRVITAGDVMADPKEVSNRYKKNEYNKILRDYYNNRGIIYYDSHDQFLTELKNLSHESIFQRNL